MSDEYYKGETRKGFYIRPMMKRFWACQMDILREIDTICTKHGIKYFADWGTLLGAVREKGYIPWDDDMDIGMLRGDYEMFKRAAAKELPEGFSLENSRQSDDAKDIFDAVVRVRNSATLQTNEEYLAEHHGCPYVSCVDIFIYDNIPDEEEERRGFMELYTFVLNVAQLSPEGVLLADGSEALLGAVAAVEEVTHQHFHEDIPIRRQLYQMADAIAAMYHDVETRNVAILGFLKDSENHIFSREWFNDIIYMPFEYINIPAPNGYHEILSRKYGDYMVPKQGYGTHHNYPYFRSQEKKLFEEYKRHGVEIPERFKE